MEPTRRKGFALPLLLLTLSSIDVARGDVFATQPSSVLTPEQSTADIVLKCRAGDSVTNAQYSWLKNNVSLDISGSAHYELAVGDLYIKDPNKNDAGWYRCRIDSDEGSAISGGAKLDFQYFLGPRDRNTHTLEVSQGSAVQFTCGDVPHGPEFSISYKWENPDTEYRIQPQKGVYVSQIDGSLYLANAQPSDNGKYDCMPRTLWELDGQRKSATADRWTFTVNPAVADYSPTFMVRPAEDTEVELNGMTYLECFASGNPTPEITWTKDGGEVPESAKVSPSGQLYFQSAGDDVEGTYTCTAASSLGSIQSSGRLNLRYKPVWIEEIHSSSFDLDSDTTLMCSSHASPVATYAWYKNTIPLDPTENNIVGGEGISQLILTNLQDRDAGIYQCVAFNDRGSTVSAASLNVRSYAPAIDPEVSSTTSAAFEYPVTINCTHTAAPAANVVWEKDGEVINSTRFHIRQDGSLHISLVLEEDAGTYTCKLSNKLGTDESTGTLKVYDPTIVTKSPEDVRTHAGESVSLTCEATKDASLSVTWKWSHGDELIQPDFFESHYSVNGGNLKIKDIGSQHNGQYSCCAVTSVGSPCAASYVYVTAPPDPPTNIKVLSQSNVTQTLSWVPGSENYSPITSYMIEQKNSYRSHWLKATTEPATLTNKTTCIVKGLHAYNDYVYRIYAVNAEGTSEVSEPSTGFSTIKGAPAKAPSNLRGGGGEIGQLVVNWRPLSPEYYGSDDVRYIVAIQKVTDEDIGVILPIKPANESKTTEPVPSYWTEATIQGGSSDNHIFKVDDEEVFAPYNVRIRAANDVAYGKWSRTKIIHTFEIAPNAAPKNLRLGNIDPRAYEADIQWDALRSETGRVDGYKIEITTVSPNGGKKQYIKTNNPLTMYTVKNLEDYHVYDARIAGYNAAGEGPMSAKFTFNTAKKPPSKAPTHFELSITDKLIKAQWTPIVYDAMEDREMEPLLGYKVEYWLNGRSSSKGMSLKTTDTKYTFELPKNGDYNVWVKGYNKGGDGPSTTVKYVSTNSVVPPGYLPCCGANTVKFNSVIVMVVTLLWMLFIKLDL